MSESREVVVHIRALLAVASSVRMSVLRALRERRRTAAEVATHVKIRRGSAQRHLLSLSRAGFVRRHEEERVWVYYSLTPAGRHLAENEKPRLTLMWTTMLTVGALASAFVAWSAWDYYRPNGQGSWGMDYIGLGPRSPFLTTGVITATILAVTAFTLAIRTWARARKSRSPEPIDADALAE